MDNDMKLPMPQKNLDYPLMKALEKRRSARKWKDEPLTEQELSNLLWAACGITKEPKRGTKSRRTSPSGCNSQEISVYVTLKEGLFLYDEKTNQLRLVIPKDVRKIIGTQKMMHSAPVGLIYVSDYSKMNHYLFRDDAQKWFMSGTDTGFMSENVYLYCAAANLNTVVLGLVNRKKLHESMGLKEHEHIVYTQVIGKPLDQ